MERPEIPENIESLALGELRELLAEMKTHVDDELASDSPDMDFLNAYASAGERVVELEVAERAVREMRERVSAAESALSAVAEAEPEVVAETDPEVEAEVEVEVEEPSAVAEVGVEGSPSRASRELARSM